MLRQIMILGLAGALALTATTALAGGRDHRGFGDGQREAYRHDDGRVRHGAHGRAKSRRWERAERKRHWQHGYRGHWHQRGRHGHGYHRDRRHWGWPHQRHSSTDHLAPVLMGAALACALHH